MPGAAIFFARDFLSREMPLLASSLGERPRVYIVLRADEAAAVRSLDPGGEVFQVGDVVPTGGAAGREPLPEDGAAIARDRTLRFAPAAEIDAVRQQLAATVDAVLARHPAPAFYFDEPVSGYANEVFSRRFQDAGALALHFQTSWVPGRLFFVSDSGQDEPVRLDLYDDGQQLAARHVADRAAGQALPHYVLSYGKVHRRLRDLVVTLGKAGYRRVARRRASYVDRDAAAHLTHARALAGSLTGRYDAAAPRASAAGRMVVFPLHYEPESLLNYFSTWYRQEEIAARLLDSLPHDWRLVLKEHPSQPGALQTSKWRDLRRAERVAILPGSYPASALMPHRPVVVSLGSTFALEAALAGCVVGVLGAVHFRDAPGIHRLDNPQDWPSLLHHQPIAPAALIEWYGAFLDRYTFGGNLMRGNTWFDDPAALIASLERAAAARQGLA